MACKSYYDVFKATMDYNLTDVVGEIECPMLITEPANEAFWRGSRVGSTIS